LPNFTWFMAAPCSIRRLRPRWRLAKALDVFPAQHLHGLFGEEFAQNIAVVDECLQVLDILARAVVFDDGHNRALAHRLGEFFAVLPGESLR
jgi:hypothetical protein